MIVREWLAQARERLDAFPSGEVDARLLLEHVQGRPLVMTAEVADLDRANELLNRRFVGEPVQYITGEGPFRYLVLQVGPGVLVPRPETELLVDVALIEIATQPNARVVDLGAGSGAIAISIATESKAHVTAIEKDPDAFQWLSRNVKSFAPHVETILADVADIELSNVDLVIANPPYVPNDQPIPDDVREHEPAVAVFGGEDGTQVPHLFLIAAHRILRSGGLLIMEHSDQHQDHIVSLANSIFSEVQRHQDLLGRPRFITARKP